jgi:hypothetical protein
MTKTINPDVAAFKDDFFKGLSLRECVFGGIALLAGAGGILLLHFYFGVGINTAITLCMPVIGIIGLCGFYQKNGMTLVQLVRSSIRLIFQKPYVYETSTINERSEMEDLNDGSKRSTKRRKQRRNNGV